MTEATKTKRKEKSGKVISNKMNNTVVVRVESTIKHPVYGKVVKRAQKFYAHHDNQDLQIGDKVLISETRPLSKLKRWRVVEKVA